MPIYEYRCANCGFQKEFLQRMSDAPLTDCPECKQSTLGKMVTAAGFQLKGGGWYVTDFKGGNKGAGSGDSKKTEKNQTDSGGSAGESGKSETKSEKAKSESSASTSAASSPSSSTSSPSSSTN